MSTRTASWLMFDIKRQQVALTHGQSPPAHWGWGRALEFPLPTGGRGRVPLWCAAGALPAHWEPGTDVPLWRAAGAPLPTGGCFSLHFRVCRLQKRVYNFDPFFDWTSSFLLV